MVREIASADASGGDCFAMTPGPGRTWLFVYGLLKPGHRPPETFTEAWADQVRGMMFDLGPYPAVVRVENWSESSTLPEVTGYTLNIATHELERLDEFEEADLEMPVYRRQRVRTLCGFEAWIYIYSLQVPDGATGPIRTWPADEL